MARTSRIDWELYKPQLLQLKGEGKSLTDIAKVLYEKLGVQFTNARLSQKFKEWRASTPAEALVQNTRTMEDVI